MVRVTTEMTFDEETKKYRQKQTPLGYYATKAEAIQALADYNHDPYDLNGSQITFDEIFQKIEFTESTNPIIDETPVADIPEQVAEPETESEQLSLFDGIDDNSLPF